MTKLLAASVSNGNVTFTLCVHQPLLTTKVLIKAEQKIEKSISNVFHRAIGCRRLDSVQQKCHVLHTKLIYPSQEELHSYTRPYILTLYTYHTR